MSLPGEVLALLSCPECRAVIRSEEGRIECSGDPPHSFPVENGIIRFGAPRLERYDDDYAARYAALWAYGYQTTHSGQAEPLYRTVAAIVAELVGDRSWGDCPIIVDSGCGVGRSLADCHRIVEGGWLIGLDGSPSMLQLAERIVSGSGSVQLDLSDRGFGQLELPGRAAENAFFFGADIARTPLKDGSADLVLCINTIDRPVEGPERVVEEGARMLRPGGSLILADPLNWQDPRLWDAYPDAAAVRTLVESFGLEVETWFGDLPYRELVDARGSVTEYRTLVVVARKAGR